MSRPISVRVIMLEGGFVVFYLFILKGFFFFFLLHVFVFVCVCACVCVSACMSAVAHVWRSEDSLQELVLSYHEGPRDHTQIVTLGSKWLHSLSQLDNSLSVN